MTKQKKSFLEQALERAGKTQEQIAEEIGVTPQAVSKWINGQAEPRPSHIRALCKALNITFQEYADECFGTDVESDKNTKIEKKEPVLVEARTINQENTNDVEVRFYRSIVSPKYVSLNQILNLKNDKRHYVIQVKDINGTHFIGVYIVNGTIKITEDIRKDNWTAVFISLAQLIVGRGEVITCVDIVDKYIVERLAFEISNGMEPYNGENFFGHYENLIELSYFDKIRIKWRKRWTKKR